MRPTDHSGEAPDRDAFARLLMDGLRAAGEKKEIRYDPEAYTLEVAGESSNRASLGNVYEEYRISAPEARAKIYRNFVRSWFAPARGIPDDYEDARHDLLPSVRARAYIEVNSLSLRARGGKDIDWTYATVGEHLALSLVYDLPESIMSVQRHHLDSWGVAFEQALQDAAANLLEISAHRFDRPAPGVWRSPWRDNHDTARLILQPLVLAHEVKGDPVAMVPNRDTLLLTGSDDPEGLAAMARIAEEAFDHPRCVSGHVLRLRDNSWVPWVPPEDNPESARFRRMRLSCLAGDYNSQKKALDAWHESQGGDDHPYVAPCILMSKDDADEAFTCTVWTESVDSLLPEADSVAFVRMSDEEKGDLLGLADWERVREVVGDLLVPDEDTYPLRYRAREFPPEALLGELLGEKGEAGETG